MGFIYFIKRQTHPNNPFNCHLLEFNVRLMESSLLISCLKLVPRHFPSSEFGKCYWFPPLWLLLIRNMLKERETMLEKKNPNIFRFSMSAIFSDQVFSSLQGFCGHFPPVFHFAVTACDTFIFCTDSFTNEFTQRTQCALF